MGLARTKVIKKKALALFKKGRFAEAANIFEQVCRQDPGDVDSWMSLAGIRLNQREFSAALQSYQKIISIFPNNAQAHVGLGNVYLSMGRTDDAQNACQTAIQVDSSLADAYFILGNISREAGSFDAAEQYYSKTLQIDPEMALANYYMGNMLRLQGCVDQAIVYYEKVNQIAPDIIEALWNKLLILPVIADTSEQITNSRKVFLQGIEALNNQLDLTSATGRKKARRGITANTNFYLQYQGCDDIDLQLAYGQLVHNVMTANYPQWTKVIDKHPVNHGEKIRIGYVSSFLRSHNGAVWLLGWLRNCDKNKFEIYCYHTGSKIDDKTDEFIKLSDYFYHIPDNIENICKQIYSDKLHVLVYPELGMDSQSMATAGLRLAPIQCVGWGHPITSGLNTMDYWLSSDLMEPEDGDNHYCEKLVRLPNMANCYSNEQHERLQATPPVKKRSDFGLSEEDIIYFCSQSLFKYLPQYDYLWPEIAKKVPNSKFVFLAISSVHVVKRFMSRIENAFNNAGLRAQDYCIMLNRQSPDDYLVLNQLVDVFLDNPPWSGNNTGLAAIDAHLPIVSYPTQYMRGRHSYAILKMLGLPELIAANEQEYIDIAERLGNDELWRKEIVQKIADQHDRLYNDVECVKGLDHFYLQVVKD